MSTISDVFLQTICRSYAFLFNQNRPVRFCPSSNTLFIEQPEGKLLSPSRISYLLAKNNKVLGLLIEKNEVILRVVQHQFFDDLDIADWQIEYSAPETHNATPQTLSNVSNWNTSTITSEVQHAAGNHPDVESTATVLKPGTSKRSSSSTKKMKQKHSYLHQIGFFHKDKDGNDIASNFQPYDFSLMTLNDLGISLTDTCPVDNTGVIRDLQAQAKSHMTSQADRRSNWEKRKPPVGAQRSLVQSTWPEEYTNFKWPEEELGAKFSWLSTEEHEEFTECFLHLPSFFWSMLHEYKQKHKRSTVDEAQNRQINYKKFESVISPLATYFRNFWHFCMKFEGSCAGWAAFLSTKRMHAFHEYIRFRAGSASTANNKSKFTQQICDWLMRDVPCLQPFYGDLWIISQRAGHFRRLMQQQKNVELMDRPSYKKLLADGKSITAEQLKQVHAEVFIKLRRTMEEWDERVGILEETETHGIAYTVQGWLQMLCHFKVGAQRQEVILHMTIDNFKLDRERNCYVLKPDFKEKKLRKLVNELCFPPDCTPFFTFFLTRVRMYLFKSDIQPKAIWLSHQSGLPQDPSAMTKSVARCCKKIIPGTHMTSLRWRHLLVTLAYLDDYLAGHADQNKFLSLLAQVQNHNVGTLMKFYNDADINKQADALIARMNQDLLQTNESNEAAASARQFLGEQEESDREQDAEDEILDDLRSMSEEETIFSDRYLAVAVKGKMWRNGKLCYWVHWEARPPTWEKLTSLKQHLDLVHDYELAVYNENEALLRQLEETEKKDKKRKRTGDEKKKKKKPKCN